MPRSVRKITAEWYEHGAPSFAERINPDLYHFIEQYREALGDELARVLHRAISNELNSTSVPSFIAMVHSGQAQSIRHIGSGRLKVLQATIPDRI